MSRIDLVDIGKSFGNAAAIEHLDLTIEAGSFTVLVGPSGCGKSTTLRLIAGLEEPTHGDVLIDGESMAGVEPGRRGIAMVFQSYALYPSMTVWQNIEYGLRNAGVPKPERTAKIEDIAETVGLVSQLRKRPGELSGGQRQRVALARAMVKNPAVFLMDEPLSNLDATLRQQMRGELVELHDRLGATFVYVTHDQVEAMSMGTRIVLMNEGKVVQESTPEDLYRTPDSVFAARFVGSPAMNIVPAEVFGRGRHDAAALAGFRPECAKLVPGGTAVGPSAVTIDGRIVSVEHLGNEVIHRARTAAGALISVRGGDHREAIGQDVAVIVEPKDVVWFDAHERRIDAGAAAAAGAVGAAGAAG